MPKIAQYESSVSQQVAGAVRAPNSGSTSNVGNIAKVATTALKAFGDVSQRMDTTAAEEAAIGFERDKNALFFNPDSGYFNTQGRNAFDQAKGTNESLEKLRKQYSEGLTTGNARQMFDKVARAHMSRASTDIMRHSSKGLQAWEVATIESQVENSVENASLYWNQPDKMKVQNVLGRQAVINAAELKGISGEALNEMLQNYETTFSSTAVTAATNSSASEGQKMLEQMSNRLEGPDQIKLEKLIATKTKQEKTQRDAQQSVLTATSLVEEFDSRTEINEIINDIPDPELRKETRREANHLLNLKQKAASEERAAAYEGAEAFIINGGSAAAYKSEDPAGWDKLSTKQKRSIESGKAVLTDWNTFSGLMTMTKDKLARVDPTDYFSQLAPAERSKLISAVKTANGTGSKNERVDSQAGRSRTAETTATVRQVFGKTADQDLEQVNAFQALVDSEVTYREQLKDGKLTSAEFTGLLADISRKTVQEDDFLFFDRERDITDIPAEDVTELSAFLRSNGIAVTTDNLLKLHKQVK